MALDWPGHGEALAPVAHVLTHLDWRLEPVVWRLPARLTAARLVELETLLNEGGAGRWWPLPEALALGLPAPVRRLLDSL